jgi:antitoxin (DNA-binding transcriptional repressor) of toxin-antitoxin stability system
MKTVELKQTSLDSCIDDAQREQVVILCQGKPVALMIGIDEEQLELGSNGKFWELISARRKEPTISRAELEQTLDVEG